MPSHSFQADRVDSTATFSTPAAGPTITGSLEYCFWEIPVDAAVLRTTTSAQCAAMQNGVAFHLAHQFSAVHVAPQVTDAARSIPQPRRTLPLMLECAALLHGEVA